MVLFVFIDEFFLLLIVYIGIFYGRKEIKLNMLNNLIIVLIVVDINVFL